MTTQLDRRSATPLWQQLLDDLLARVKGGDFADAFPGELVLQEQYGVSRQTVRQALRKLREDGVVTAARGRVAVTPHRPRSSNRSARSTACSPPCTRPGSTSTASCAPSTFGPTESSPTG